MDARDSKLEKMILDLVRADVKTTPMLVNKIGHRDSSISESETRRMVWQLVDCGKLTLNRYRRLAIRK